MRKFLIVFILFILVSKGTNINSPYYSISKNEVDQNIINKENEESKIRYRESTELFQVITNYKTTQLPKTPVYNFFDENSDNEEITDTIYYRIKATRKDGSSYYSKVVPVAVKRKRKDVEAELVNKILSGKIKL